MKLSDLLTPPAKCLAVPALPLPDRRKGAIWHCPHARQNIGKGRKQPECLCASALSATHRDRLLPDNEDYRQGYASGYADAYGDVTALKAKLDETKRELLAEREKYASIADKYAQNNKGGRNPQSFAAYTVATEIARDIRAPQKPSF